MIIPQFLWVGSLGLGQQMVSQGRDEGAGQGCGLTWVSATLVQVVDGIPVLASLIPCKLSRGATLSSQRPPHFLSHGPTMFMPPRELLRGWL